MNVHDTVKALLEKDLTPLARRVDAGLAAELAAGFERWTEATGAEEESAGELAARLVQYLLLRIEETVERVIALHVRYAEFSQRCLHAATEAERRQHILDYAEQLGADPRRLRGDRRAFGRWLGHDAMADRYARRVAAAEREMAFCAQRLGVAAAAAVEKGNGDGGRERIWRNLNIERVVTRLLAHDGDSRVRLEAFRCLATAVKRLPAESRATSLAEGTLQFIFRSALESRHDVWAQCEALSLLQATSPASLETALQRRIGEPHGKDDLFVRRHAVRLLGENIGQLPGLVHLIPAALSDPSPYVRQALAQALRRAPGEAALTALKALATGDAVPQVRAAALLQLVPLALERRELLQPLLDVLVEALRKENDAFVLRVACKTAADSVTVFQGQGLLEAARTWHTALLQELEHLHQSASSLAVRRWAAQARERMWCATDPAARRLRTELSAALARFGAGRRTGRLPRGLFRGADEETAGRVLAVLCQEDFGLDIEPGFFGARAVRGHQMRFRTWRLLYELLRPAPDKRQAFRHTIGRVFRGRIHVPSGIMSELSETKVPGEPLHMESESGWRPYLPLVDESLSSLECSSVRHPLRVFTAEGITEVTPPRWALMRLWAWLRLTLGFGGYARLRNWEETTPHGPAAYVHALRALGFRVQFRAYRAENGAPLEDPAVRRFFSAGMFAFAQDFWARLREYFFSVYENSLFELVVFALAAAAVFFGRTLYASVAMRRTRAALPLVIGGWGTRGKSGTERLKAALLNACGCGILSKTTGCEPMFLHAHPFGPLRDMLLFRPYEKATIWEQFNVARLARRLGADVLLWECMALTPAFVRILQRQWMRDDIATITNTYPDHEDIQGPAGINVAEVMTNFVPAKTTLLTSEEQMRPILNASAQGLGTEVLSVDWLDAGLIAPDVLKRFPYEEHPYNVALVTALGEMLGIPSDFALKEMGDRVVPDIGVLKAYPRARVRGRWFEFVNGMSANERYGTLGNWRRTGFYDHDPERDPEVWVSTVVNNRADRVARSRVFSHVLVYDVGADSHCVIGTNLTGLMGYVAEDWEAYAREITLWPESAEDANPRRVAEGIARRSRMPVRGEDIRRRLQAMLEGLTGGPDLGAAATAWQTPEDLTQRLESAGLKEYARDIIRHIVHWRTFVEEYEEVMRRVDTGMERREAMNHAFRGLLRRWFESKFVVVEDSHASGEKILEQIIQATPPGLRNRIMGMQNIKGAGLNFVYCWQAWDRCHRACVQLRSRQSDEVTSGLRFLSAFQDYGRLCEECVRESLELVVREPIAQTERFQAELAVIRSNLDSALRRVDERLSQVRHTGWVSRAIGAVEAFLDAGDAVRRRKLADRIYEDLVNERIGHERANRELQTIQYREKGGWLQDALLRLRARFTEGGDDMPGAALQRPLKPGRETVR